MPDNNLVFTGYCEKCKTKFTYRFSKNQLEQKSGGIYSGVFLHNSKDNKEIHAVLAYFDSNLADRGSEDSNVIQTSDISLECIQVNTLPSLKEGMTTNREIKVIYEWLINEYISYFKNKEHPEDKLSPVLNKILEDSKALSEIYGKFALISDKTGDKILFDSQTTDFDTIENGELKKAYQTLFDQIRTRLKEEDENEALEASKKLGLKIVTLWKDIVKSGLSEDMFRILEGLLSFQNHSDE
ncbi:MAG: hypothetical protein WED07_14265 [Candidatus Freyarchaeum deiterrae]